VALCEDPRLSYFSRQGHYTLLLPQAGMETLNLLRRDQGGINPLATLNATCISSAPAPDPKPPRVPVDLTSTKGDEIKLSLVLLR